MDIILTSEIISCNSTYRLRYWNETDVVIDIQRMDIELQQYLPFTVLKLTFKAKPLSVHTMLQQYLPFTVLKLYWKLYVLLLRNEQCCNSTYRLRYWNSVPIPTFKFYVDKLQQYLPFTVLKHIYRLRLTKKYTHRLQQYLPFTVLKLSHITFTQYLICDWVATAPTVYGIETHWARQCGQRNQCVATAPTVYGIETLQTSLRI